MPSRSAIERIARLMALQRTLAWLFPALATVLTLFFFVSMATRASWLARVAFGRFGSLSIVAALSILAVVALCVGSYGALSNLIERRRTDIGVSD